MAALLLAATVVLAGCGGGDSEPVASGGQRAAPPKSDPVAYTKHVVDQAVELYDEQGLNAVLEHVGDLDSIDGQWYVFVVGADDTIIGHHNPSRLGLDLKGRGGTDINGYQYGARLLAADESGSWVGYVNRNPGAAGGIASGDPASGSFHDFYAESIYDNPRHIEQLGLDGSGFELKNAWAVRHDGLLFVSGWYVDVDEFIESLTDDIARSLDEKGAAATIEFYNKPENLTEGFTETVGYYNSVKIGGREWVGFYAQSDGTITFHNNPALVGLNIADILGPAAVKPRPEPQWIDQTDNPEHSGPLSMRIRIVTRNDTIFGTGWYSEHP